MHTMHQSRSITGHHRMLPVEPGQVRRLVLLYQKPQLQMCSSPQEPVSDYMGSRRGSGRKLPPTPDQYAVSIILHFLNQISIESNRKKSQLVALSAYSPRLISSFRLRRSSAHLRQQYLWCYFKRRFVFDDFHAAFCKQRALDFQLKSILNRLSCSKHYLVTQCCRNCPCNKIKSCHKSTDTSKTRVIERCKKSFSAALTITPPDTQNYRKFPDNTSLCRTSQIIPILRRCPTA